MPLSCICEHSVGQYYYHLHIEIPQAFFLSRPGWSDPAPPAQFRLVPPLNFPKSSKSLDSEHRPVYVRMYDNAADVVPIRRYGCRYMEGTSSGSGVDVERVDTEAM